MAKKIVNVVYKVDSKELDNVKKSLQANQQEAKKFDDNLKKVDKTAKDTGSNASKSFMDFKNILGTISFVGILSGLTSLGRKIFDLGVQQEQLNIAFTTFLGSAEKAKKLMAELTRFSIITPFTPDQVNKAAKTLLAFGTQAKDIIPTLKMIGDVSSGTGKDLAEMAVIFGQIQSTGRLMGQDLLQLINAGFNPLQIISEKTGKSVKVLKEEMEKGLISFDMVKQAFKDATSEGGLFFNLMEKQSQTVGGKMSTFAGNIDEAFKNIYSDNAGKVASIMSLLVTLSEKLMAITEPLEQKYKKSVKEFGVMSDEAKELAKELMFEFGPEKAKELMAKTQAELAIGFTNNWTGTMDELKTSLTDFIRLKEQQLQKELKVDDNSEKRIERYNVLKKTLELAKERLKEVENDLLKLDLAGKNGGNDVKKPSSPTEPDDPFVKIAEKSKSGWDMILDTAYEGGKTMEELLADFNKDISSDLEERYDFEENLRKEATDKEIKDEEEKQQRIKDIRQRAFEFGVDMLGALLISSLDSNRTEMAAIDEKYSRELELAGNNEQAKKTIEKRRDQERKEAMKRQEQEERDHRVKVILAEALVNSVKALGLPPIPGANFIAAAQALAYGALQAGLAGKYKDGGWINGPGTTTSDSVPILASKDEFMVNAAAAAQSPNLLEAINNREINDNILRAVASTGGRQVNMLDDSRIVKAIRENQVDYISHGYTLLKVQKSGENFKRMIRSKIQGY